LIASSYASSSVVTRVSRSSGPGQEPIVKHVRKGYGSIKSPNSGAFVSILQREL